jgi:hypothetical protein
MKKHEWEDNGMDQEYGAQKSLELARRYNFPKGEHLFDSVTEK